MFHVLLPLIAILPGMLLLIGVGILLLGIALIIAAIAIFIVRAARKSKKKGSLITAIILLALGLALEAPVAWVVVQIMAYRTGETVEVESRGVYDSLPIVVAGARSGLIVAVPDSGLPFVPSSEYSNTLASTASL